MISTARMMSTIGRPREIDSWNPNHITTAAITTSLVTNSGIDSTVCW